jgi:hypothetical protein
MSRPVEDYVAQIAAARRTSRRVHAFAAISWFAGWLVILGCLVAWLGFGVSLVDSLEIVLAIGVAGLLGGVGLYAQGRNLDLSASRLELALGTRDP